VTTDEGVVGTEQLRRDLSGMLQRLRADPRAIVRVGRQRRPEAVLISYALWQELTSAARRDGAAAAGEAVSPTQADLRWDPDAGLDYEVVESTLGVLISHCVARHTAAAEDPGHADPAAEVWLQRLQFYAQQRHEMKTLLSRDPGALRDARARYARELRELTAS
jgi:hypothetical protein